MRYLRNEPLKKHTSFRIGGPANYFMVPKNEEELIKAIEFARDQKLGIALIGAGSNLLPLDKGFSGLAIKLAGGLSSLRIENNTLYAGAGVLLPKLVRAAESRRLSGIEFLAGIPGTVGGAIMMNAGAWGKGIGSKLYSVKIIDRSGRIRELDRSEMRFGYRKSSLQESGAVIVGAILKLRRGKKKRIRDKIKEYIAIRKNSQPLGIPNAGSIFKNPPGNFAGKLIEEAGLKGLRIGDAQVSTKHANFIVNLGDASARDIIRLITRVQKTVKDKFNIKLEPELKIMVKSPR
jgi:UDP-N-acetylmuramate dehydrogenase